MGFLPRLLTLRDVRRAAHPVRSAKQAAAVTGGKKATRAVHPVTVLHDAGC